MSDASPFAWRARLRPPGALERLLALTVTALVVTACRSRPAPPQAHPDASAPPSDHLANDEVPEGVEKAFALPLPRASQVAVRFPDSVHVTSSLTPEQLANFVRTRVQEGKVTSGATTTRFEDVSVAADPKRHLTVEVRPGKPLSGTRSEMVVKDVTPLPGPPPGESEAERRRKAGLTPDGKLLDPQHMQ